MSEETRPSTMFAWQFTSTDGGIEKNLRFEQKLAPPPYNLSRGPTTLIRVLSASLNPEDYAVPEMGLFRRLYMSLPAIPGTDFVGRILETNVSGFAAGDLVFGYLGMPGTYGSLAEYAVVNGTTGLVKVPESFLKTPRGRDDLDELACVGIAGWTALDSLREIANAPDHGRGKSVFINGGSGGVGTFAIQIAKHVLDVEKVIASCSTGNVELLKSLGADEVVDYTKQDVIQSLKDWTSQSGKKLDFFIDNVGKNLDFFWQAHHYVKAEGGKFILVGVPSPITFGFMLSLLKMKSLPTFLGGGHRPLRLVAVDMRWEDLDNIGRWMAEGKIKAVIDSRVLIKGVPEAISRLRSRRAKGKIVVRISD